MVLVVNGTFGVQVSTKADRGTAQDQAMIVPQFGGREPSWSISSDLSKGRDPIDHIDMRISYSGSEAQYKGDSRNSAL